MPRKYLYKKLKRTHLPISRARSLRGSLYMYKSYNSRGKWYKHPHATKNVIDGVGVRRRHRTTKYRWNSNRNKGMLMKRVRTLSGQVAWRRPFKGLAG